MLDALPEARQRYCIGRWLGIAALGPRPQLLDFYKGQDDGKTAAERESEQERDWQTLRKKVEETTLTTLTSTEQLTLEAFLERLFRDVENAGASEFITERAAKLRQAIDLYLESPADPFDDVADAAREHARAFYGDRDFDVSSDELRFWLIVTTPDGDAPLLPVDGGCAPSGEGINVDTILNAERFWRPAMCSLLYVMLHELVVHAFAVEPTSDAPELDAVSVDGFADGWMDVVAFELHETLTTPASPSTAPLRDVLPLGEQQSESGAMHRMRIADRPVLGECATAARLARDVLEKADGTSGRSSMQAFSLALNRSGLDHIVRATACVRLRELLEDSDDASRKNAESDWVAAANAVREAATGAEAVEYAEAFASSLIATVLAHE